MSDHNPSKKLIILYKLLVDLAVILLAVFFLFTLAESALPTLISAYISFTKILFIIILDLGAILILGGRYKFGYIEPRNWTKKSPLFGKTEIILIILTMLISLRFLLKTQWLFIVPITAISLFILIYLYKVFFSPETE